MAGHAEPARHPGADEEDGPGWDAAVEAHRARTRQRILDAALELVAERGVAGVAMSHIAARAGIGRATLYHHFPDLESMLLAHMVQEFEDHHRALDAALAELADPVDRLRAFVEATVAYFASGTHRHDSAVGASQQLSPAGARVAAELFRGVHARTAQLVREAAAAGALDPSLDPDFTAELLGQLLGGARTAVLAERTDPDRAAAAVLRLFLHGAAPPR